MSRGKCSGCGLENASCAKIRTHINTCPEYVALFKTEPERCLDPEDEMVKWVAWLDSDEGRLQVQNAKEAKHLGYKTDAEAKIAVARERWSGNDHPTVVGS